MEITYFGTSHGHGNRSEVYNKLEEIKPEVLTLEMQFIDSEVIHTDEFIINYMLKLFGQEIVGDPIVGKETLLDRTELSANSDGETMELVRLSYIKNIYDGEKLIGDLPTQIGEIINPEELAFLTYAIDNKIPIYCIENVRTIPTYDDFGLDCITSDDTSMKDENVVTRLQPTDLENLLHLRLSAPIPTNFNKDYNEEDPQFVEQSNRIMAHNLNNLLKREVLFHNLEPDCFYNKSVAHLSGSTHLGFENSDTDSDKALIKNLTEKSLLLQDLVNSKNFTLWDCLENKEYQS